MGLASLLLERAKPEVAEALVAVADLEARLEAMHAAGARAWPGVTLDAEVFVAWLAERLDVDEPVAASLEQLRADDLYLACACAQRRSAATEQAIVTFRARFYDGIRAALGRSGPADLVDELAQQVMTKLFVADAERPAAIHKYAGRGALASWVQVMAVRDLRSHLRRPSETPSEEIDKLVERAIRVEHDPELSMLKRSYRRRFKEAFESAFRSLSARERNLLRHECIDQLSIDEIGAIYGVHRATAARWRQGAREALFAETKRCFVEDMKVSGQEFESIMRLIHSQVDVSLPRLLASDD